MILILSIIFAVIAIGTMVILTTEKNDIKTIKVSNNKKSISSEISSIRSKSNLCPDGKVLINNECKMKLIKSDCTKFEIPDPLTKLTTCKKIDEKSKNEVCKQEGKVLYNNECLVEIDQKYCENKGSYLKPDPNTNNTSCTKMNSEDIKNICSKTQVFYDGECKEVLTEKNCSKKLFKVPDSDKKNTECRNLKPYEINDYCRTLNKNYFAEGCHDIVDQEYCKNLNWQHSNEKLFHKYVDENTNSTRCREPNELEKIKICNDNDLVYNKEKDKCLCPEGADMRDGKCLSIKTKELCFPKITATTNVANFTKPDPGDPLSCINMSELEKKDYCKKYKIEPKVPSWDVDNWDQIDEKFKIVLKEAGYNKNIWNQNQINEILVWELLSNDLQQKLTNIGYNKTGWNGEYDNFTYRNNKCMKIFTNEECKSDLELPNYKNNKLYDQIFYKKPNKLKDNTECRLMTKEEEEIECKKSENNTLWIDNKCIKKLVKPEISKISSDIDQIKINVNLSDIETITDFSIKYKIAKKINDFKEWIHKNITIDKIVDNSFILVIDSLKHNTEYKIKVKIESNNYAQIISPESDVLFIQTSCDSTKYTDLKCRMKDTKILGPQIGNMFGIVDEDKKDSSVSKWPYIKIPNIDPIKNKACGCKEMNDEEREKWCKDNLYQNIDFKNGRQVIVENDKCKLNIVPVGPPENLSAVGLDLNQTILNDINLEPQYYRTDYPSRIKIYWTYPEESIRKSLNFNDAIPHTYKIERTEKGNNNWVHIHNYVVRNELDYENINTYNLKQEKHYNIYLDDDMNYKSCNECILETNNLICNKDELCITKKSFDQIFLKQKSINQPTQTLEGQIFEAFSDQSVDSNILKKQHKTFMWIDGDYGSSSLFIPNQLTNYNDPNEKLKSNTIYQYKITPINNSGEGLSGIIEAKTILERKKQNECTLYEDINSDYYSKLGINDFPGFRQVTDEWQTKCISRPPLLRADDCSKLTFTIDSKNLNGIYDPIKKKCVPLEKYKLPEKPQIINIETTKDSVIFEIIPPTNKGSPIMTGYWIEYNEKDINNNRRLVYNSQYNIRGTEVIDYPDIRKNYLKYPSETWQDGSSMNHNDTIKIIHKSQILKPATEYEYRVKTISENELWKLAPGSIAISSDNGYILATSNLVTFTATTKYSYPTDVPTLQSNLSPSNNKIPINIGSFPAGKEGGIGANIIKYKITRIRYNKNTGKSDISSKIDFIIDFSGSNIILTKEKNGITEIITNNVNSDIFIENPYGSISKYQSFIFYDNSVLPLSKYNYSIKCMNNKDIYNINVGYNEKMWSKIDKSIDIESLAKNPIYDINLTNSKIQIYNKQRSQINSEPNYSMFIVSINNLIDPNINNYKDFPTLYKQKEIIITFTISYLEGVTKSIYKIGQYDSINEKYFANFKVPLNKNFDIIVNCKIKGNLKIPGSISQNFNSIGTKELSSIINGSEVLLKDSTDKSAGNYCSKYSETINDIYTVDLYYNDSNGGECKSRKYTANSNSNIYLDEYCENRLSGTKWWGNLEEEPCKKPIDGSWEEITLTDNFKSTCFQLTNDYNIIGKERFCLIDPTKNEAWKPLKKWKYTPPKFGGNIGSQPPESSNTDSNKKYIKQNNIAFLLEKCSSIPKCWDECKDDFGNLRNIGGETGLSLADFNTNSYCVRPGVKLPVIQNYSNCELCGNPEGPEKNKEWIKFTTCVDGKNGDDKLINCKYKLSDQKDSSGRKIPISLENDETSPKLPTKILKNKWYQCRSSGSDSKTSDPIYNIIKNKDRISKFCDPPEISTTFDYIQNGVVTGSDTIVQKKYFKLEDANCGDYGDFELCKIKDTTPQTGWNSNVCGKVNIDSKILCKTSINNSINTSGVDNLWSCSNTLEEDSYGNKLTPTEYYNKHLNKDNTKSRWVFDKKIKCKDKCEGENSEASADGYDKWVGDYSDNTPYYSTKDPIYLSNCKAKSMIYPLYNEGIKSDSRCSDCSSTPSKLHDECVDGKYGPDDKIKCKNANKVIMGDTATYTKDNNIIVDKPNNALLGNSSITYNFNDSDGDKIISSLWKTAKYNKPCPDKYCVWESEKVDLDKSTRTRLNTCRGDKIKTNSKCYSIDNDTSLKVEIDNTNNICGPNPDGNIIEGNSSCRLGNNVIWDVSSSNKEDHNVVSSINKQVECNKPAKNYEVAKICIDPSGNEVSTYNKIDAVDCFIKNEKTKKYDIKKLQSEITPVENNCTCTCKYSNTNVNIGESATGTDCTVNGGNICKSCYAGTNTRLVNNQCVCNENYRWNGSKCVKDCLMSEPIEKMEGCVKTTTRTILQHPDGGNQCGSTTETTKPNTPCTWTVKGTGWKASTYTPYAVLKINYVRGCKNGDTKPWTDCKNELKFDDEGWSKAFVFPRKYKGNYAGSSKFCKLRDDSGNLYDIQYHKNLRCPPSRGGLMDSWVDSMANMYTKRAHITYDKTKENKSIDINYNGKKTLPWNNGKIKFNGYYTSWGNTSPN